ncbi:uncharacterized protein M421DRAFT_395305 [Didymella exigua CBS 183.55]|uniref:Uncharacterized protein n=1 Tax=Didymella exigua CBS 183.55 TaxID=1150837 RepID=A0A6A5S1J8_9PLEO|nr:uncharacterized protein M421DRAFT_395305 [Didymella exigua CBS 183.55]KAF1933324.1 hypothetical protein M421DRAFT_395305 [Didymella exigua CBS 183.55]
MAPPQGIHLHLKLHCMHTSVSARTLICICVALHWPIGIRSRQLPYYQFNGTVTVMLSPTYPITERDKLQHGKATITELCAMSLIVSTSAPCLCSPQLPARGRPPDLPDLPIQVSALRDNSDPTLCANHSAAAISDDELLWVTSYADLVPSFQQSGRGAGRG